MASFANGYLKMEFEGITFTADGVGYGFLTEKFPPRVPEEIIEIGKDNRSVYGAFAEFGRAYEDKHIFDFGLVIDNDAAATIDAMYHLYHSLRRTSQNPLILVTDTTRAFTEVGNARTRAKAPAPFDQVTATTIGSRTQYTYYAKFYCKFAQRPEYKGSGLYTVDLKLVEADTKVPLSADG